MCFMASCVFNYWFLQAIVVAAICSNSVAGVASVMVTANEVAYRFPRFLEKRTVLFVVVRAPSTHDSDLALSRSIKHFHCLPTSS